MKHEKMIVLQMSMILTSTQILLRNIKLENVLQVLEKMNALKGSDVHFQEWQKVMILKITNKLK